MTKIVCSSDRSGYFKKGVQGNIPKPLRNLYTKFDVNTLRPCGEKACVEEHLHPFGNSDIASRGKSPRISYGVKSLSPTAFGKLHEPFCLLTPVHLLRRCYAPAAYPPNYVCIDKTHPLFLVQ